MRIIEFRALRGANYYSLYPVIYMRLDIEELENRPSHTVPDLLANIKHLLPSLIDHHCSPNKRGGFFERIEKGTWAGHIIEHIAIELQCLADMEVSYGKTFTLKEKGVYDVVFSYKVEEAGLAAAKYAVEITERLFEDKKTSIPPIVEHLKEIKRNQLFGPSTQAIVDEAVKRGIPIFSLNNRSLLQLGYGKNQRRIQATMADSTSSVALDIAADKQTTKNLLSEMGIPVPNGYTAKTAEEALAIVGKLGYPVTVKPLTGNHGRGITTNILNADEIEAAFKIAKEVTEVIVVEEFLSGADYRILVIDGKLVAAAKREPASVTGDGISTIEELIEQVNQDPERGVYHEKTLTKIKIDDITKRLVAQNKYSLQSVLPAGEKLRIKSAANISAGGTATDVTDEIHPAIRGVAERASRIIGLNIIGIDMILDDHRKPLSATKGGIIEVNAAPGFRMHTHPSSGKPRNVGAAVLNMLFPKNAEPTIPIVAITGTNGKTTTARLISHTLKKRGNMVGMTSTDGLVIGDETILEGDYSGPEGAKIVLQDSTVEYAVLEVARGGILRRGLGYEQSDVAVVTNISKDHFGEGDIDTLKKMARLKGTIVEVVKPSGFVILNADDELVLSLKEKTKARVILFSMNYENPALRQHFLDGNPIVTLYNGSVIIQSESGLSIIADEKDIPLTLGGMAEFNVENVLASVAAVYALGLTEEEIRAGITSFNPSFEQSPGRLNIIEMNGFKVMIDYGHNVGAIKATGEMLPKLSSGKKIRTADGTGNRRSVDIVEFGESIARYYDYVFVTDTHPKHRKVGETSSLVEEGLKKGGLKTEQFETIIDDREATLKALEMAKKGDIVVLQANDVNQLIADVLAFKDKNLNPYARQMNGTETPKGYFPEPQKTGTTD
ncbi:MAG: cyanophycin synthetase [Balneolaceae bacterium]